MLTPKDVRALLAAADDDASLFIPCAALATLVRTEGSSFRRIGSQMLVGGNGRIVRGFSGGCPESDLALRARKVIDGGSWERVRYDREQGLDVLIEMGCGGELEVMIEPVARRTSLRFLDVISGLWRSRSAAMMASVFPLHSRDGVVRRLIWRGTEIVLDELHGEAGAIMAAAASSRVAMMRPMPGVGVAAEVLYESIQPPIQLVLIGANAVADAVACAAQELAWAVVRIDPKTMPPERFAQQCSVAGSDGASSCDVNSFVVCMTNQIERDVDYAAAALATAVPYVGVLGSHRRAEQVTQRLVDRHGMAARERLYTPAGLSIGSEDAEAIAISLIAEIMAVAAHKSGLPLSRSGEPIHFDLADPPENAGEARP